MINLPHAARVFGNSPNYVHFTFFVLSCGERVSNGKFLGRPACAVTNCEITLTWFILF